VRTSGPGGETPLVQLSDVPPPSVTGLENEQLRYRHTQDKPSADIDRDYLETLEKCELLKYYTARQQALPLPKPPPAHLDRETWSGPVQQFKTWKSAKLGRYSFNQCKVYIIYCFLLSIIELVLCPVVLNSCPYLNNHSCITAPSWRTREPP